MINQKWVLAKNPPAGFSNKAYYVEPGCEYGSKDEDGVSWYRISCSYWFGDWIETQSAGSWRAHGAPHRAIYIVSEELMFIIKLKWM